MISLLMAKTEEHRFAFRLEDVEEVLLLPHLEQRAGDLAMVEGWLRLRGQSFPTISLANILGLGEEPSRLTDHLVLTRAQPRVAWRVNRVEGLDEIGWEQLSLLEHSAEPTPCYVAQFESAGHPTHLLNVAGLLLMEEQERLKQSQEKREQRLQRLAAPCEAHPDHGF